MGTVTEFRGQGAICALVPLAFPDLSALHLLGAYGSS
jgi:hypothetical protein